MSEQQIQIQQIQARAIAEILKIIIPQGFSSNEVMADSEYGKIDEWKMTKFSGSAMMTLIYLRHRGENDGVRFYKEFTDHFLRGSHSIDGTGLKMLESIAIGLAGGGRKGGIVKKPGIIGRTFTNRNWERNAREKGQQVAE